MAPIPGTGTPGANQDGQADRPVGTPGEVLIVGQSAANSAPAPEIDLDLQLLYTQTAFDLAVKGPLRDRQIWDQFATVSPTNSALNGSIVRKFFGDDIDPAGADVPLLENLDVDSVSFGGRAIDLTMMEYGRAVSRTRLANVRTVINIDPQIVDRVAYDASRAADLLAKNAFVAGVTSGVSYIAPAGTAIPSVPGSFAAGSGDTWLSTTMLQMGIAELEKRNVMGFRGGRYVCLTGPTGAQHLKNERDTGGFRYVVARNNGDAGNDIFRGQIGMIEGADIVVSNTVPAGKAYLIGVDALAKVYTNKEGYGVQPHTVVAPVVDKLRRFLSWGWLHYVGYKMFDTRSVITFNITDAYRPAGSDNIGVEPGAFTPVTGW